MVVVGTRTDGTSSTRWDSIAARVTLRDANGDYDGWEMPDGTLVTGSLRSPSAAKLAAMAAVKATAQATRDKDALARAAIKAEVARILGKSAATRTVSEKGFLGLAWLVFREE
jgi:hypothetical protein